MMNLLPSVCWNNSVSVINEVCVWACVKVLKHDAENISIWIRLHKQMLEIYHQIVESVIKKELKRLGTHFM